MNAVAGTLERLAREALSERNRQFAAESLDSNKSLITEYGLDSVALLKLLMAIESAFDIEIRDEDLNTDNFDSLATILGLLEREYGVCGETTG